MSDTNETIADIIAEMRVLSNTISDGIIVINGRSIADRFEAAWKREKAAIEADALSAGGLVEAMRQKKATAEKSSAVGDAAKLREALTKVKEWMARRIATGGFEFSATLPTMLEDVVLPALAAPPRNCDSYDSADEMMKEYADDAFLEEWKEWRETGKCNPLMIDALLCINWLFLTNEKGETNGSK